MMECPFGSAQVVRLYGIGGRMRKWTNCPKDINPYEGFVYEITNDLNGKKYIGKKVFWNNKRTKPRKGMKNGKKTRVESDWRTYWGSSRELLLDYKSQGGKGFRRRILLLCESRWEMSYHEARLQFSEEVLLRPEYYNEYIGLRLRRRK
jgi:hypothetical protein